jgi:hypothetical protein
MSQFRNYVKDRDGGPVSRIGRTYKTFAACLKMAIRLSREYSWVEINDDALSLLNKGRYKGYVKKGIVSLLDENLRLPGSL